MAQERLEVPSRTVLGVLLGIYLLVLLLPAGFLPLQESTEARYSEIAREMVASGNYLEPVFNGIKHFHKPPLSFWAMAAGFQLFGVNDFGARFFGVLATGLAVLYLYRLAVVLLGERRQAWWAALIFASSVLLLIVSRAASTDIYLTAFTLMAQFHLFRRLYAERLRRDPFLFALALGLGFLTKGPIIFLFTLLPFFVAKMFDPGHRRVFGWGEVAGGILVFAAVTLPWFLAVAARNPGLFDYLIQVQTVDRVVTNRFRRYQPPWYFLGIFAATFLPYSLFFLRGLFSRRVRTPRVRVMLLYVAAPFLVFSVAKGKLPPYILPLYGMAAVLTADFLASFPMRAVRKAALVFLCLLPPALAAAAFFYPPVAALRPPILAGALAAAAVAWSAARNLEGERFIPLSALLLLLVGSVGGAGAVVASPQMKGYERMVDQINALDPQRRLEVVVFKDFLPSISFYRDRLAVMALGTGRETAFQRDDEFRRHYLDTPEGVQDFLKGKDEIFVVTRPGNMEEFTSQYRYRCTEVARQRKHSAYSCRRLEAATVGKGAIPPG